MEKLKAAGIESTVIILPYEYQLRMNQVHYLIPQKIVSQYLTAHDLPSIDAFPDFQAMGRPSKDFFLLGDHMHLSPLGHKVAFNILNRTISVNQ